MPIIAVAGGAGQLGRAIVDALHAAGSSVIILGRQANIHSSTPTDVPFIAVDYSDVQALRSVLEENRVTTIISTIAISDDSGGEAQLNLIDAAIESSSTARFIPSEFGFIYNDSHAAMFPPIKWKIMAAQRLKSSGLEYTLISNGLFMDIFGLPKVKSYLQPFPFGIDMVNNAAAIPGSGNVPVVFTHTTDIAKYVVALVNTTNWTERSIIIGDKVTWNELLALAETIKGKTFDVKYDDDDKLRDFQVTELPAHEAMYPFIPREKLQNLLAVFGQWMSSGNFNLPNMETLNKRFPEIGALSMKELLLRAWAV